MNAVRKLEVVGPALGYPHTSDVRGAERIRELRPRAGRSPWRGLYRRVGPDALVIAAIAPEAQVDQRRSAAGRGCRRRLDDIELDEIGED